MVAVGRGSDPNEVAREAEEAPAAARFVRSACGLHSLGFGERVRTRWPRYKLPLLRLSCLVVLISAGLISAGHGRPVSLASLELDRVRSGVAVEVQVTVSRLAVRALPGGHELSLAQIEGHHAAFGGISGLARIGQDTVFVTDRGWIGRFADTSSGGALSIAMRPLRLNKGADQRDAEALAIERGADGEAEALWIAFERAHRLVRVEGDTSRTFPLPWRGCLKRNGGIEALAVDGSARLVALAEEPELCGGAKDRIDVWVGQPGAWERRSAVRTNNFSPTGAAFAPDGSLYLLERRFTWIGGIWMRLRRFSAAEIAQSDWGEGETIVTLDGASGIDNMEALLIEQDSSGRTVVTALADDNFNLLQRTVVLTLRLAEGS